MKKKRLTQGLLLGGALILGMLMIPMIDNPLGRIDNPLGRIDNPLGRIDNPLG